MEEGSVLHDDVLPVRCIDGSPQDARGWERGVWGCPVSVDGLLAIGLRVGHGGLHVGFVGHG